MTSTTEKVQTLRCQHGEGHEWTRPSQRGKPPKFCPEHKPTEAPRIVRKPIDKIGEHQGSSYATDLDVKMAQANDEIAELDAEEARKKAEAVAKRQATIAAKKAEEAREAAQARREELAHIKATIGDMFKSYERAFDKANKTNSLEDWHESEVLMDRCIGMRTRQRALEAQVGV